MRRRDLLRTGALAGAGALAGCAGLQTRQIPAAPPILEDRPDAVYYPTHVEGMQMGGMGQSGEYRFAVMYSYPHRFWNVNGTSASHTPIEDGDSVHLMASVWDVETNTVLPETGLTVEVLKGGETVSEEVIYPMLSQPMGFHYGANFGLDGDGDYTARLRVGGVSTRKSGGFAGRLAEGATAEVGFEFTQEQLSEVMFETLDNAGERGAVKPMEMEMLPNSRAPETLPGERVGEGESGDATFVFVAADVPDGIEGEGTYLAASARTPYNRMVLPAMALSGTLTRDGETVYEGAFTRTLDSDFGYHYGAVVDSVVAGDVLALRVETPPQVARHEGYETAFLEMPPMEISLS